MSTAEVQTRKENFPLEMLRYAEEKVSLIRRELLEKASAIASSNSSGPEYTVKKEDVDKADHAVRSSAQ